MSQRQKRDVYQVHTGSAAELNQVLSRLSDRLDKMEGFRGNSRVFDALEVAPPESPSDAPQSGEQVSKQGTGETVTADKTFTKCGIRFLDGDGELIHGIAISEE